MLTTQNSHIGIASCAHKRVIYHTPACCTRFFAVHNAEELGALALGALALAALELAALKLAALELAAAISSPSVPSSNRPKDP